MAKIIKLYRRYREQYSHYKFIKIDLRGKLPTVKNTIKDIEALYAEKKYSYLDPLESIFVYFHIKKMVGRQKKKGRTCLFMIKNRTDELDTVLAWSGSLLYVKRDDLTFHEIFYVKKTLGESLRTDLYLVLVRKKSIPKWLLFMEILKRYLV